MATNLSYAQISEKTADLTLYSCEIVNEPLKKYISEKFLPVIFRGVESGKIEGYYIFMEIYKGESHTSVELVCETGLRSGMVVRHQNLKNKNLRLMYFTVVDGDTIEIFCNKQSDFIKADFSKRKIVKYFTDPIIFVSDSSYEVRLKFDGERLESYEVTDFVGLAEPKESDLVSEKIYPANMVDERPYFHGGNKAMVEWIRENMNYPSEASIEDSKSTVYISFCISETGEIYDVKVQWSRYEIFEEEAIRLVKTMPAWVPGRCHGVPVKVREVIPIVFYKNNL
ncbi:MAG: energy transducer TonB [Muribaculaceae bacterium]|nr:energy transducer TonB [Muribaculaceae bacterium]